MKLPATPHQNVLIHLLFTNCVSILAWGSEVKEYLVNEFRELNTAVNSAIRQIFSCYWQTVSDIREEFGHKSPEMFVISKDRFKKSLAVSSNSLIKLLYHFQLTDV